jgi:uncharacterized protein DUF4157/lysine-specific metallo-endopeptidase family protein
MFEVKRSRPDAKSTAANDRAASRPAAPGASLAWTFGDLYVQRRCACEGSDERCEHCAEEMPFRRPAPGAGHASLAHALATGGGVPLDPATNAYFGARFGRDFGDVRVRTDDASARAVGALAYTAGSQIVFRGGTFAPATRDGRSLLAHELAHVVQQGGGARGLQRAGGPRDRYEAEADRAAEEAVAGRSVDTLTAVAPPRPQRQPAPTRFVVEDTAPDFEPGQMRKTEFLRLLREAACRAVEEALAGTGYTTDSCPYLDRWFAYYGGRDAEHVDRALRLYAPDAASAATAAEAIRAVAARARRAAEHWVATGEVSGVPPDVDVAAAGLGVVGGALAGAAGTVGGAVSGAAAAVGGAISGAARAAGGLLFSARPGGARPAPASVGGGALGAGRSLEAGVRSRMEGAFGRSFGGVRVHAGGPAASLSDRLNAHAFTLGSDIVFGAGEFRPGTLAGDVLIAHELAHVAQQSHGAGAADAALEGEADTAAADAILGRRAGTRLGGGLRLQRCRRGRAPALPAPSPTDYLVTGRKVDPGDATSIYFDRASATIDPAEQPKIPSVIAMAGAAAPLTLVGYRSEDEAAGLATSRPTAVASALATSVPTPYTATPTVQPEPTRGIGEIRYREMRKVEIQMPVAPGFVTPSVPACPTPVIPCGTSFTTAQPRAITFLNTAIAALAGPLAPATTTLLTQLFGGASGPASAPTVQANLTALRGHITAMAAPGRHVCHDTRCDSGCGSSDAYNTGVGGAAVMTLCSGFINDPSVDSRAWTLIHEGAHGTAGLAATTDIAYRTERRIRALTNAEALRNPDSYTLLVQLINFPGSVPIGFAGDVTAGMAAPEQAAAATALAHAEKWLIQSYQDVGFAYDTAKVSIPAGTWTGTRAAFDRETLHRLAGRFAGLTDPGTSAPFPLPTAADKEKLAALADRYERMFRVMYGHGITMRKIPAGSDRWAAGPGTTVELTPAFFTLPTVVAQVRRLVELLAAATPGISPPLVPQYVDAADAIRAHRGLGP